MAITSLHSLTSLRIVLMSVGKFKVLLVPSYSLNVDGAWLTDSIIDYSNII